MSDSRNRVKILRVSAEVLISCFQMDGKWLLTSHGMPEDAKIVAMDVMSRLDRNELSLRIHSETFPEVGDGCVCPEIVVTYSCETPEHYLEQKGVEAVFDDAGNGVLLKPGKFRFRDLEAAREEVTLIHDPIERPAKMKKVGPYNPPEFGPMQHASITVESAGVDPAHQTSRCDFCACPLGEGQGIATRTQYRHVTLCEECHGQAESTAR